jgi:hypothetical protein
LRASLGVPWEQGQELPMGFTNLLEPPDKRPKAFWRGYDVYAPVKIGFVSQGLEAEQVGTKPDVNLKGGENQGHEFGIDLSPEEKEALVEFLKTL